MTSLAGVLTVALALGACGGGGAGDGEAGGGGAAPGPVCEGPVGPCDTVTCSYPEAVGVHVASCTPIDFATNPPTSGPHYPQWARFESYTQAIARGFWVHSMEHGAVTLAYDCPGGCAGDLGALEAVVAAQPQDPACAAPVVTRIVLTPDPDLDAPIAAAAWGFALTAQCVDAPLVEAFVAAHYARAPEDECGGGIDPTDPVNAIPADCGQP
ncbi:MAG: DUF3105 domain-containing protein [Polyangiaceae bacterium]|nr:DUF3105 domain-containing protein [Polyangiaceae bacterium]